LRRARGRRLAGPAQRRRDPVPAPRRRRQLMRYVVVILACLLAVPHVARAQSADVPGLIKLVQNQPNDMDRSTWKEKRRDAARKLAESKDRRAVPVLIKLAETETFDIIGEIAIEGLGTLGDPSAVPTLQQIVG